MNGNRVDFTVEAEIEDFLAVAPPADGLCAGAGDGKPRAGCGRAVTAGEGLQVECWIRALSVWMRNLLGESLNLDSRQRFSRGSLRLPSGQTKVC